jgi:hypothetical protein
LMVMDKRMILLAIKSDIEFLASHNLMDYSLLLTVENRQQRSIRNVSHVDLDFILETMEN